VTDFLGAYNAILGRPGYTKFMVVPNYTYLKLKMTSHLGLLRRPPHSKQTTSARKLVASSHQYKPSQDSWRSCGEAPSPGDVPNAPKAGSGAFKSTEDTKDIRIDNANSSKHVRIRAILSDRQESALIDFLQTNHDVFTWKPADMPRIPREFVEHSLNI
jgi:hypothetical protein